METSIQITFQAVPPSDALEGAVRKEAAALQRYSTASRVATSPSPNRTATSTRGGCTA